MASATPTMPSTSPGWSAVPGVTPSAWAWTLPRIAGWTVQWLWCATKSITCAPHEDDELQLATWIIDWDQRLRMTRRFQLQRPRDGVTLLRAQTTFACIELSSGKPRRMPAEFLDGYGPALIGA